MPSFLIIASAHFLALLSPGPDFLLIIRLTSASGWRLASGACLGIAVANGAFIALAFGGMAFGGMDMLNPASPLFKALQTAGGGYLIYLAWVFLANSRPPSASTPDAQGRTLTSLHQVSWRQAFSMGLASALLNPKNALFYASLASMLAASQPQPVWLALCGLWMFCAVLSWDMLVAIALGNEHARHRYSSLLPAIEKASGLLLGLLGLLMIWHTLR